MDKLDYVLATLAICLQLLVGVGGLLVIFGAENQQYSRDTLVQLDSKLAQIESGTLPGNTEEAFRWIRNARAFMQGSQEGLSRSRRADLNSAILVLLGLGLHLVVLARVFQRSRQAK